MVRRLASDLDILRYDSLSQASLHFCSECNNLLYPKAEQQRRTMVYACRICPNVDETVDNGLVYRNDLLNVTK
jgi:DNA-directed RNA polymerase II subunit RPB9